MLLFDYIDRALIKEESRSSYVSRKLSLWPSEASAELIDKRKDGIVGKCHRAVFLRLTGKQISNPIDAKGARRFRTGRAIELDMIEMAKQAGIYVASGVRAKVEEVGMSFEMDLIVRDPASEPSQIYIVENKTVYGHGAREVIGGQKPKIEGVMQTCMYLNEIKDGAKLKAIIRQEYETRLALEEQLQKTNDEKEQGAILIKLARNRMDYCPVALGKCSDGPVKTKMAYESRDDCDTAEFDVELFQDAIDHFHYPMINGEVWKGFTVESIYSRYATIKKYYENAVNWVNAQLGHLNPDSPEYWAAFTEKIRQVPTSLWPPAEYEWKYTSQKIQRLYNEGLLSKSKYDEWARVSAGRNRKPRPVPIVGAWECQYCNYRMECLSAQSSGSMEEDFLVKDILQAQSESESDELPW